MNSKTFSPINNVVEHQLCAGCGACAYVEPGRFEMGDVLEYGRRPFLKDGAVEETGEAFAVCPGASLKHRFDRKDPALSDELIEGWGPVLDVWEGYAADSEIRYSASSGGAATALALYCVERGGMEQVLHTAARKDVAYLNETVISKTRRDLLEATGSRYAPSSPCDGLGQIEKSSGKSVFIGKPCDVAAVQSVRKIRSELDQKTGVTIAFFCAGVPSTKGNLALLKKEGVETPGAVTSLRYRGNGWPGNWLAKYKDDDGEDRSVSKTYEESWGYLQSYRQWRCYICPDHTGEFADISVGDPWYRAVASGEPGKSLIVARTSRGAEIIKSAADAGYIVLETRDLSLLPRSQPNLLAARGQLWARLVTLKILGAAVPSFDGFKTFTFWCKQLSLIEKVRSFSGTAKRTFTKGLRRKVRITKWYPTGNGDGV